MRQERATTTVWMAAMLALAAGPCLAQAKGKPARPAQGPAPKVAVVESAAGALPLRLTGDGVMGYVAIPDLERLLAHVEATGNAVAPEALPPGAARSGLAAKLGVPGLEGLAARPILLVLLKGAGPMGPPRPVLFLPVKDPKAFEGTFTTMGWKSRKATGLIIASSTPEGLLASAPLEAEYKKIVSAGIGHDMRIFFAMGRLMDAYGPLMQMGLDAAMAPKPSTDPAKQDKPLSPGAEKLLKLEIKAFVAMLGQLDDVQWDMDLQDEGLVSDTVVTARAGSALDELARMAPAGANRAAALLSGSGFMTATYQLDPARVTAFLAAIFRESATDPAAAEFLTPDVLSILEQTGSTYGGQVAYRMASTGGKLSVESVMQVTDEAKAMALMEKGLALFAPGGSWAGILEEAKMTMTLQKNARRYAGVPVHRLKLKTTAKTQTADEKAMQAAFLRDTEFAATNGYYVSAQDPAGLNALIDRAAAGTTAEGLGLRSAQAFGEGRHAYVDYDIIGLMKAASTLTPPVKGQPNPFAALPDSAEPMLAALTFADGRIRWQSRLPLKSFAQMGETMKKSAPATPPGKTPPPRK
jgi:hypothetical protein